MSRNTIGPIKSIIILIVVLVTLILIALPK